MNERYEAYLRVYPALRHIAGVRMPAGTPSSAGLAPQAGAG
jgi:hypothetical protein